MSELDLPASLFKPERLPDLELVGYLHRWCVIPRNLSRNQYLHHILAADEPIFHDHPWEFKTVILSGGYAEMTGVGRKHRMPGDVIEHDAAAGHYIETVLPDTWTMVFTGPVKREWGFLVDGEWVRWDRHPSRCKSIYRNGYND